MTSLLMLSGCAPTQTVCQNDNSKVERVNLPDAWAMTAPEIATEPDTTQPASKPEALRITTENNLKWIKDRNKLNQMGKLAGKIATKDVEEKIYDEIKKILNKK